MRRVTWILPLLLLLLLAACGGDESKPLVEPEPEPGENSFVFYVYTIHDGGEELLRWIGTPEGPAADAPEPTPVPWVGYGQPFRVEWRITSANGDITGYRYRVSADPSFYLPSDTTWDDTTSFTFLNSFAAEDLVGEDCEGGPECPEKLRLDSGQHTVEVTAIDEAGIETNPVDGLLTIEINYPPDTAIRQDGVRECAEDPPFPRYRALLNDFSYESCSFVEGDTIPAGAVVTMELEGWDRLAVHGYPDSFCCDVRIDDQAPELAGFKGLVLGSAPDDNGNERYYGSIYGSLTAGNRLSFRAGPLDYTFFGRAFDPHLRKDTTPDSLTFHAGFRPRVMALSPPEGARVVLRDPRGAPAPWPVNEIEYTVSGPATRNWDTEIERWVTYEGDQVIPLGGYWFQIPMRLEGAPHPREIEVYPYLEGEYAASIRSWAYEWIGQNDPENYIIHGSGDDLRDFRTPFPPTYDLWVMEGEDAPSIFVPNLFWDHPEWFDPEGACDTPFCAVGVELLRDLGTIQLTAIGKTTASNSEWCQHPPSEIEGTDPCSSFGLGDVGRRSDPGSVSFTIHLGLDDGTGNLGETFPPEP